MVLSPRSREYYLIIYEAINKLVDLKQVSRSDA
jgi:hypothetical protein